MASMTIRNIDEQLKHSLRIQAAAHGWSMEEEVRQILHKAITTKEKAEEPLGTRIHKLFMEAGGLDLGTISRTDMPRIVELPDGHS
ncbi:plasmid stabilization protein [Oceanispirochaeta sp. M2]|nr:plasmid stabilization protein [Oceanispirochaeta sp. M2]NPD74372.1 plasmid stabilization protein [Oceanispirochaeta sp. M1]RDG29759.1 plasmid stabilization protein [Oceanispirochaeta sp. M1]